LLRGGGSLLGQLAQGDGQIARGAFEPIGAGFEFLDTVLRLDADGLERGRNLYAEAFCGRLRLLLGARRLSRG
jgi:hypothetical protein